MFTTLDFSMIERMNTGIDGAQARLAAGKSFDRAFSRGRLSQFWAQITRRPNSLADLPAQPVSAHRRTSQVVLVPIDQIKGSVGRSADFDAQFHPLHEHSRERWISVASARRQEIPLPPVDLVQVGEAYYVQDGHHRISVAKAQRQDIIEARIVN